MMRLAYSSIAVLACATTMAYGQAKQGSKKGDLDTAHSLLDLFDKQPKAIHDVYAKAYELLNDKNATLADLGKNAEFVALCQKNGLTHLGGPMLGCAAVMGAQTTLDPKQMKEWTPNSKYGAHAFGKKGFANFLKDREEILPWIAEYSPYALASKGDPPVYITYGSAPAMGKPQRDPTHTANFGIGLQKHCKELGIACDIVYPGAPKITHKTPTDYLIATLKATKK